MAWIVHAFRDKRTVHCPLHKSYELPKSSDLFCTLILPPPPAATTTTITTTTTTTTTTSTTATTTAHNFCHSDPVLSSGFLLVLCWTSPTRPYPKKLSSSHCRAGIKSWSTLHENIFCMISISHIAGHFAWILNLTFVQVFTISLG